MKLKIALYFSLAGLGLVGLYALFWGTLFAGGPAYWTMGALSALLFYPLVRIISRRRRRRRFFIVGTCLALIIGIGIPAFHSKLDREMADSLKLLPYKAAAAQMPNPRIRAILEESRFPALARRHLGQKMILGESDPDLAWFTLLETERQTFAKILAALRPGEVGRTCETSESMEQLGCFLKTVEALSSARILRSAYIDQLAVMGSSLARELTQASPEATAPANLPVLIWALQAFGRRSKPSDLIQPFKPQSSAIARERVRQFDELESRVDSELLLKNVRLAEQFLALNRESLREPSAAQALDAELEKATGTLGALPDDSHAAIAPLEFSFPLPFDETLLKASLWAEKWDYRKLALASPAPNP